MRAVEDHHVDRSGVEVQRCMKLTDTNCSIGLKSRMPGRLSPKKLGMALGQNGHQTEYFC